MIEIEMVEAYDTFWQNITSCQLPTDIIKTGLFSSAKIVRPVENKVHFDEDFDIITAGGGPSGMLISGMLAKKGYSVLLLERNKKHLSSSTWNLSRGEYEELKKTNILNERQWKELVVGDFSEGFFRIYDSSKPDFSQREFQYNGILNISLDDTKFFKFISKTNNLLIRTGSEAKLYAITDKGVYIKSQKENNDTIIKGRLFIDARGWTSPLVALINSQREVDSVYNMIGVHTIEPLQRIYKNDPHKPVGLICATFENEINTDAGMVQPILERFTNYVDGEVDNGDIIYYFTRTTKPVPLAPLFKDFMKRIDSVLPGFTENMVDRTYYGHAPSYYLQTNPWKLKRQMSAGDRTLFVGCAGHQYSGLTGCAFGALARNAVRIHTAIDRALSNDDLSFKMLNRIDIDPRERATQSMTDLFAGVMELGENEDPGTVNRDWISISEMGQKLDPCSRNEIHCDKATIKTLNKMLAICMLKPEIIKILLRNNHDHIDTVILTFILSYIKLFTIEFWLLLKNIHLKYFSGIIWGILLSPVYLFNSGRLYIKMQKALRRKKKQNISGT